MICREGVVLSKETETTVLNWTDYADPLWARLRSEAKKVAGEEQMLAGYVHSAVLMHTHLEASLSFILAEKLASPHLAALPLRVVMFEAMVSASCIAKAVRQDLTAVLERDPAARSIYTPFLHFKGFQVLQAHRVAHWLWGQGRTALALYFQTRVSEVFAVDIHPAAVMGAGILFDHGTGIVIGETAVVEDNVSILHEVTLGGTGKESGDRHPKVGGGVLIGAGAKILGNIRIGTGAKIAACSVVLTEVPPHTTVAGIPARIVGRPKAAAPAMQMNQLIEEDYCI